MPKKASSPETPRFISRVRAAEMLDCSVQLIDKFIREKKLTGSRIGGRKIILREDELLQFVEAGEIQ